MSERGVRMVVVFKRRVTNELLTTYLPSLLLILTTYCTTFFKPFYFEAAVTVNLTTMLGPASQHIRSVHMGDNMDMDLPCTIQIKSLSGWL